MATGGAWQWPPLITAMDEEIITLPFPPSGNRVYRVGWHGRVHLSVEATNWIEDAAWRIKTSCGRSKVLHVYAKTFFPARRGDIDNFNKLLLDAIKTSGIVDDDKWPHIPRLYLDAELDRKNPRIELKIVPIS